MKSKLSGILLFTLLCSFQFSFGSAKTEIFELKSNNELISLRVEVGEQIHWSVKHGEQNILMPSEISLILASGEVLGGNAAVTSDALESVDSSFQAINYKKAEIIDQYNQLTLTFENDFGLVFRVYDDAVAYRFLTDRTEEMIIENEIANFNFAEDFDAFIPYMWDYRDGMIFNSSFEALYQEIKLSEFEEGSLAFSPLLVDVGQGKKVVILEADLENYPGMYLDLNETEKGLTGVFAKYSLKTRTGGYHGMNVIPIERAEYIAKLNGTKSFPWRAIAISESDKDLLNNDIVQKLASPSRIEDISWIEPGQVAWDWWNDYNLKNVDFEAGQNTRTYQYYIDFASANHAKYIIIDGGWTDAVDLKKLNPDVDLQEIIDYGNTQNVGVIIWASWQAVMNQMDELFPVYEKMGVKGLKIDFIDRDDQEAVHSTYLIAEKAAQHKLLVDYHGVFKPTGLQRTYPNVVGYEGVKGLENYKWADEDAPRYAVSIPFIRMMAGPMDYTSGAMVNVSQDKFAPINNAPMSKGTRCHQVAMYVIYEVPIQMLSDSPSLYMQEQETTDFITQIPTVFDETVALQSEVGKYVAIARRKGEVWYVGAMTDWQSRDLTIDLSFLDKGDYRAVIFSDGVNAHKVGTDYKREEMPITSGQKLNIHLSNGGGWAARIEKQ